MLALALSSDGVMVSRGYSGECYCGGREMKFPMAQEFWRLQVCGDCEEFVFGPR